MKTLNTVLKIVGALAAIAGIVFVAIRYGDKIVAWAKDLLCKWGLCKCDCCCEVESSCEEVPAEEGEVQAEEKDFEGQ